MSTSYPSMTIELPDWTETFISSIDPVSFSTIEGRMRFAIAIARVNIKAGTGGPFGAAIFDLTTHELIAPGMNLVLSSQCSVLHAEIVAIMVAQKIRGIYDLGAKGLQPVELVTSVAPCAMCLGALPWAGIARLVCGARDEDARSVGFDEGAKVINWIGELGQRGIETVVDICRVEAMDVLKDYSTTGGIIYNSDLKKQKG